jgi:hypothetical protein
MKYYPCKNKTEFSTLLVMAENNGWRIDMGLCSAEDYAEKYWPKGVRVFAAMDLKGKRISGHYTLNENIHQEISFPEMAAILVNTAQPEITQKDFADYVCGFLCLTEQDPNLKNLSVENMKIALANSANCLDCPNDGIEAYIKRRAAQS